MLLIAQKCIPCRIGAPTLTPKVVEKFKKEIAKNWIVKDNPQRIERVFEFTNFKNALHFVNQVGELAEKEGHHPNIRLFGYKYVEISAWTHKIGGLHQNDFILAAKIDKLAN